MITKIDEAREPVRQSETSRSAPTSLAGALAEAEVKREADVIRFRTCCADVRASK